MSSKPLFEHAATLLEQQRNPLNKDLLNRMTHPEPYKRSSAAQILGEQRTREAFPYLVRLSFDPVHHVRRDALIGLGQGRDSRAYFFLASYFLQIEGNAELYSLQEAIITAFNVNHDPRSRELLERAMEEEALKPLAVQAMEQLASQFIYTFHGDEETRLAASQLRGKKIESPSDLEELFPIFEKDFHPKRGGIRPQTYVILPSGEFRLGGELQEHVQVASGQDILAAGEMYFEKDSGKWLLKSVNNRSNGYYPDNTSLAIVQEVLQKKGFAIEDLLQDHFPKDGWLDETLLNIHWLSVGGERKP